MITCLFGSSRNNGNSKVILDYLLYGTNHQIYNLFDTNIEKVIDNRHSDVDSIDLHQDDYSKVLKSVMGSDTIIFSTPLYWYSMSASLKLFIDRWTESLRGEQRNNFKEAMAKKKYIVMIVGGDNPIIKSKPLVEQFKYIFEFMNITDYTFLIGEGVAPSDVLKDGNVIKKVKSLNLDLRDRSKNA
ncbi:flavodoxin family protein [Staphylococcus shinii]|uniref:Flavodoxin family protein n=1 Tax=Staphylococcus shinii TaxID=2912228 RepID=A0A418IFW6_9STAP|nr:NAD(P)H-dependent oxidoreductase [Staphylococcus shinii]MDW8563789.1 NAD(P)H-dependent oxidoreductase [Staphylococcus shinii]MDW8567029.1 NAD(P)H-dependent oxidoreductase [Staphylococcus shinii]RIN01111.1 flavodoxin family protein [Staphylococcus shinii]RIN06113.1 flavodoxin family protein [Staphylococcus shinii]